MLCAPPDLVRSAGRQARPPDTHRSASSAEHNNPFPPVKKGFSRNDGNKGFLGVSFVSFGRAQNAICAMIEKFGQRTPR